MESWAAHCWSKSSSQLWTNSGSRFGPKTGSTFWAKPGSRFLSKSGSRFSTKMGPHFSSYLGSGFRGCVGTRLWSSIEEKLEPRFPKNLSATACASSGFWCFSITKRSLGTTYPGCPRSCARLILARFATGSKLSSWAPTGDPSSPKTGTRSWLFFGPRFGSKSGSPFGAKSGPLSGSQTGSTSGAQFRNPNAAGRVPENLRCRATSPARRACSLTQPLRGPLLYVRCAQLPGITTHGVS